MASNFRCWNWKLINARFTCESNLALQSYLLFFLSVKDFFGGELSSLVRFLLQVSCFDSLEHQCEWFLRIWADLQVEIQILCFKILLSCLHSRLPSRKNQLLFLNGQRIPKQAPRGHTEHRTPLEGQHLWSQYQFRQDQKCRLYYPQIIRSTIS